MEFESNIHQVIAPHLALMRQDIREGWPTLDPELALLHWLCERNQVKPPRKSLICKSASLRGSSQPLPDAWRRGVPADLWESGKAEKGGCEGGSSGSTASPGFLPPLSSSGDSPRDVHPVLPEKAQTFRGLRSMQLISEHGDRDAAQSAVRLEALQKNCDKMRCAITNTRQELRGKYVSNMPLLSTEVLSQEEQYIVVGKLRPRNFSANDILVTEGNLGDELFIIERGVCEASSPSLPSCELHREEFFGELAVVYARPYTVTVIAKTNVTVLTLSRADLLSSIGEDTMARLLTAARVRLFRDIPLLRMLSAQQKLYISGRLRCDVCPAGTTLARQAAHVHLDMQRMYIIEEGSCRSVLKEELLSLVGQTLRGTVKHFKSGLGSLNSRRFDGDLVMSVKANRHVGYFGLNPGDIVEFEVALDSSSERGAQAVNVKRVEDEKASACSDSEMLAPGQYFSMLSMFFGSAETRTVIAETDVKTLSISHSELEKIFADGEEGQSIKSVVQKSMRCYLIRQLEQLQEKDEEVILMVEKHAKEVPYNKWDVVFHQGDKLDAIFILAEGSLVECAGDILSFQDGELSAPDASSTAAHSLPGTHFGALCLQDGLAAMSTTLAASTACTMLRIPGFIVRGILKKRGLERPRTIRTSKAL